MYYKTRQGFNFSLVRRGPQIASKLCAVASSQNQKTKCPIRGRGVDLCGIDHRNTNVRFDQFDLQVKQTTTVKYSDSGGSGFESRCVSSNGFSIFFLHSYAFL